MTTWRRCCCASRPWRSAECAAAGRRAPRAPRTADRPASSGQRGHLAGARRRAWLDRSRRAAAVLFGQPLDGARTLPRSSCWPPRSRRLAIASGELLGIDAVDVLASTGARDAPRARSAGRRTATTSTRIALAERGDRPIGAADLVHGRFLLLRRGRPPTTWWRPSEPVGRGRFPGGDGRLSEAS